MKVRIDPLIACDQAAAFVRQAGFILVWTSLKSEACYYAFPGRHGVLRIAAHPKRKDKAMALTNGPTLASATFCMGAVGKDGKVSMSDLHVENTVCNAIGRYMLKSKPPHSPN